MRIHTSGKTANRVVMFVQFASQRMSVVIDLHAVFKNDPQTGDVPELPAPVRKLLDCNLTGFGIEIDMEALKKCWPETNPYKTTALRVNLSIKCQNLGTKNPSLKHMMSLLFDYNYEKEIPTDWSDASLSNVRYAGRDACHSKRIWIFLQIVKINMEKEDLRNRFRIDNIEQDIIIRKNKVAQSQDPVFIMLLSPESMSCIQAGIPTENLIGSMYSLLGAMQFDQLTIDEPILIKSKKTWRITAHTTVYSLNGQTLIPVGISATADVDKILNICTKSQKKAALNALIEEILNDAKLRNVFKSYKDDKILDFLLKQSIHVNIQK